MQRTIPFAQLIVSLAVVGIVGVAPVEAQTIDGQLPDEGGCQLGRVIRIDDTAGVAADHCGFPWVDYPCLVIDTSERVALRTTCSLPDTLAVAVGDLFQIQTQQPCNGQLELTLLTLRVFPPHQRRDGLLRNDGGCHIGEIIVFTDRKPNSATGCGTSFDEYEAVTISPGGGPATRIVVAIRQNLTVDPGDRFEIVDQQPCDGFLSLSLARLAGQLVIVSGNMFNDGQDYVGRIVAVTDRRPSSADHCGVTYNDYKCVIIDPDGGPAINTECGVDQLLNVHAGDRFDILDQTPCDGRLDLTMTKK